MPCKPPQPTVPANTCGCAVLAVSTRKFLMPGCQDKSHNCKSTASPAPVQLSSCRNTKPYGYKGSFIQMLGLQLNVPGALNLQKAMQTKLSLKQVGRQRSQTRKLFDFLPLHSWDSPTSAPTTAAGTLWMGRPCHQQPAVLSLPCFPLHTSATNSLDGCGSQVCLAMARFLLHCTAYWRAVLFCIHRTGCLKKTGASFPDCRPILTDSK